MFESVQEAMNLLTQEVVTATPPAPDWQLWVIAGFGLLVLTIFAVVRIATANARMGFTVAFSRTMGLITLAMLAVVLAAAAGPIEVKTAAFTLLGTIAGFFITEKSGGDKVSGSRGGSADADAGKGESRSDADTGSGDPLQAGDDTT